MEEKSINLKKDLKRTIVIVLIIIVVLIVLYFINIRTNWLVEIGNF